MRKATTKIKIFATNYEITCSIRTNETSICYHTNEAGEPVQRLNNRIISSAIATTTKTRYLTFSTIYTIFVFCFDTCWLFCDRFIHCRRPASPRSIYFSFTAHRVCDFIFSWMIDMDEHICTTLLEKESAALKQ